MHSDKVIATVWFLSHFIIRGHWCLKDPLATHELGIEIKVSESIILQTEGLYFGLFA